MTEMGSPPIDRPGARLDTDSTRPVEAETFTPNWAVVEESEFTGVDPVVSRLAGRLNVTPESRLRPDRLKEWHNKLQVFRDKIEDAVIGEAASIEELRTVDAADILLDRMKIKIRELKDSGDEDIAAGAQKKPERGSLTGTAVPPDSEDEEEERSGTSERREKKGRGYSNFVSNEGAQRRFYEDWFLSSPPGWFGELPEKWKEVVRTRMFINNQAAIKRKDGPFELDPVLDNRDMRIDKEALITMWKEMPGFRQAFATMWHNFFEIHPSGFVEVKGTAFPLLKNFPKYKETLKEKIKNYIDLSNGLEGFKKGPNGSSLTMAEAAVASAWNLIYVSNVVDSGDLERNIKGEVVAEQVRTFFRPLRKGQSKWLRDSEMGEVIGTDESWGGQLGDWYAERCRHDTNFSKNVKEGRIRYIPTRLMYSWFDIQKIDGETLGAKLTKEVKRKVVVSDDQRKTSVLIEGLWDFDKGAKAIDFESLEGDNLWPGYADAADSARLIYKIIQGTAKDPEMRQVATAFSKLREVGRKNFKPLAQVYNDEQLIVGCILGMLGGPIHFSTELVVAMPDDKYDSTITRLLREDRLFTGFADPRAARRKIMELLHASDLDNPFNIFGQQLAGSFLGKRGRLRIAASLAASQKVGRF